MKPEQPAITSPIESFLQILIQDQEKKLYSIGPLMIFLHCANGLLVDWSMPRDKEEARNYRLFQHLNSITDRTLLNAAINGQLKPPAFIHPFESYYTLPGYLDAVVLPCFFETADHLARGLAEKEPTQWEGAEFLAFIYIFFLVIHPFVDGNGRVARGLLNYYNRKLRRGLKEIWNDNNPAFRERQFHPEAFKQFFQDEVGVAPRNSLDPYPLSPELERHVARMADYLIDWAVKARRGEALASRCHVRTLALGIEEASRSSDAV
jgi:hypothetical protein